MFWHLAGETACPTSLHSPHEVPTRHTFSPEFRIHTGKNACATARSPSHFFGNGVRLPIVARQELIGFGVANELHLRRVKTEFASKAIGDVAEVAECCREVRLLNFSV